MKYANEDIVASLKAARRTLGLSQSALTERTGLPQSHISKIESGATNLKLSSLIELARALDLELVLVPRSIVPAVYALAFTGTQTARTGSSYKAVQRAQKAVTRLTQSPSVNRAVLKKLDEILRSLAKVRLTADELKDIDQAALKLAKIELSQELTGKVERVEQLLRSIRNRAAHNLTEERRPAYSLDDDDDA